MSIWEYLYLLNQLIIYNTTHALIMHIIQSGYLLGNDMNLLDFIVLLVIATSPFWIAFGIIGLSELINKIIN